MGHTQSISLTVAAFRGTYKMPTLSQGTINMLISSARRGMDNSHQQKQDGRHENHSGKVQEGYLNCMQRINTLLK